MHIFETLRLTAAFSLALLSVSIPAPAVAQGRRVVDIATSDGVVLKGTLFPAARPGPAVLLLPQCDDQRTVWDALGTRLATAGVTALAIDYRGYGESGGVPHERLSPQDAGAIVAKQWPTDIDSALALLIRQPGVQATRVGAGGGSCGVNNAVALAQRHPNVKALALLAGPVDRAGRLFLQRKGALPIFAAAAGDDRYANFVEIMSWIDGVSPNPQSRLAQYPTGGHAAVMFRSHPGLADTMATWFSAVLSGRTQSIPRTNGVAMNAAVLALLEEIDRPGGARAVGRRLADARRTDPRAQLFPEYMANQLGYEHVVMRDIAGALEIMKLEVQAYPRSPNAMDSLGDVYLANGDRAMALQCARQTIALLAQDTVDSEQRKKDIRAAADEKIRTLTPK